MTESNITLSHNYYILRGVIMITVYPVLRQRMIEQDVTFGELAAVAGITKISLYAKMWGIGRWKLTEVLKICCFFSTPDAEHLFVRNHSKSQILESQDKNYHV